MEVLQFPDQVVKQRVERRQSAVEKTWKKNERLIREKTLAVTKTQNFKSEDTLTKWRSIISEREASCERFNVEYFSEESEYQNPHADFYKDPIAVANKMQKVFENIFSRESTKDFFQLFESSMNECSNPQYINQLVEIFSRVEICRPFEADFFTHTIFEASEIHNYDSDFNQMIFASFIHELKKLVDDQKTLENHIFVLTILKKIPSHWVEIDDPYVFDEIKEYYVEAFDIWKDFQKISEEEKLVDQCQYYKDYLSFTNEVGERVQELLNNVSGDY